MDCWVPKVFLSSPCWFLELESLTFVTAAVPDHSCSHLEEIKNRVCFPGPVSLWSKFSKHSFLHLPPSPIDLLPPHLAQISAKVRTNNLPEVMFGTIMSLCLLLFPSFSNSRSSVLLKRKTFRKLTSFYPTLK